MSFPENKILFIKKDLIEKEKEIEFQTLLNSSPLANGRTKAQIIVAKSMNLTPFLVHF